MSLYNAIPSTSSESKLRQELSDAYHLSVQYGWDDLIYGHISVRLPEEPDCYLINPFGLLFDEITPDNLLKVRVDGKIIGNNEFNYNPAGENMHHTIYKNRRNVNSIVHFHSTNGVALSSLNDGLLPISQQACHFYNQIAFHDYEGIAIEKSEQKTLIGDLGDKDIMILRNHGFLTAGRNLQDAFCTMYTLEKTAAIQMAILSSGQKFDIISKEICEKVVKQTPEIKNCDLEWKAMVRGLRRKQAQSEPIALPSGKLLEFIEKHEYNEKPFAADVAVQL